MNLRSEFKRNIISLFHNFLLMKELLCSAAHHRATNRSVNDKQRAVTICQEVFEWTVYLPFGSDDTIWALLTVFLAPSTSPPWKPPRPMSRYLVQPRSIAISPLSLVVFVSLVPYDNLVSCFLLFSFLFLHSRLLFPFLRFRDGTSCRTGIPSDTQNGWLENFIS